MTSVEPKPPGFRARQERYFDAYPIFHGDPETVLKEAEREVFRAAVAASKPDDTEAFVDPAWERDVARAELAALREEHERFLVAWAATMDSVSWRITRPLRDAKGRLGRLLN